MPHALNCEEGDWPTTLRYSRRLGESVRGAEYAMAIEGPRPRAGWIDAWLNWIGRLRDLLPKRALRPN